MPQGSARSDQKVGGPNLSTNRQYLCTEVLTNKEPSAWIVPVPVCVATFNFRGEEVGRDAR